MIEKIDFQFGSSEDADNLSFMPGPMTVFVGPNHSGKSLSLSEIAQNITGGSGEAISEIEVDNIDLDYLWNRVEPEDNEKSMGELSEDDRIEVQNRSLVGSGLGTSRYRNNLRSFKSALESGNSRLREIALRSLVLWLDGEKRLNLLSNKGLGDLKSAPRNHLMALFKDEDARGKVQEIIRETFGRFFVIDPTGGNLVVRLAEEEPKNEYVETGLGKESIEYYNGEPRIDTFSDGVKAFAGILSAVMSSQYRCALIDEPDAFLHPPLSKKLGRFLTETASEREGNVFAATHDSNFLIGCVQAGRDVNVVRLTYNESEDIATARLLEGDRLQEMMQDPLMRSTDVLDALFHQGAVICEGDVDRAFYEEVSLRIRRMEGQEKDTVFLNAFEKSTIKDIVAPLREMGVPAAAVVDLDIVKEADLTRLMKAAGAPEKLQRNLGQRKKEVKNAFKEADSDPKEGKKALPAEEQEVLEDLRESAARYGVFIVPVGEVEDWLEWLDTPSWMENRDWLKEAFQQMGSDPESDDYATPSDNDVWEFVRSIREWIGDPNRKGIPE
jgi:energy-coupling factor transporter ATP-binding protein EcfA2